MMRAVPLALPLFLLLALPLVLPMGPYAGYVLDTGARIAIFGIAALSLDLLLGAGGLVSFGHAAFLAIGAYAVAILDANALTDASIVVPVVLAASLAFSLPTGAVALRTRGVNFIMITLAFAQMVYFAAGSLTDYGGDDGYTLSMRTKLLHLPLLATPRGFYAACLALLLGCFLFNQALLASRFGRALRAIRQNRVRVQGLGIHPFAIQLTAIAISGMMAALAGALLANAAEFVSPAYAAWQRSGDLLIMVILGGAGNLHGAIFGAAAVVLTEEALGHVTEHWRILYGPLLVLAVIFFRGGLAGIGRRR